MPLAAPTGLTATVETDRQAVRVNVTPPAGATGLRIWRVAPSANTADVRGWSPGPASGATPVIARDYEAPLELELDYYAAASDATGYGATAGPATVTIAAGWCETWLVDLARPINSLRVLTESLAELHFPAAVGVHRVLGRRGPVLTSLPAWTPTGELVVLTDDLAERDAVRALLGSGFPFLLRTTPELGIGNMYCGLTEFVEARIVSDGRPPVPAVPRRGRPGRTARPGPVRPRRPEHLRRREGGVRRLRRGPRPRPHLRPAREHLPREPPREPGDPVAAGRRLT